VTLWMFRLSYNTWRRGLFNLKDEDYRWEFLRRAMHPVLFIIFNLTFIAFTQNILLLSLGFPTYFAAMLPHEALTITDYTLFTTGILILGLEFTSDNQQWAFQNFKRLFREHEMSCVATGKATNTFTPTLPRSARWPFAVVSFTPSDARRGFITKGLWAWSRHPNFLCEQSFWILITLFPVLALPLPTIVKLQQNPVPYLIPFVPCLSLVALFASSTVFTESITLSRYPEYRIYQKRVGMFLPIPWGWFFNEDERKKVNRVLWGNDKED